VACFASPRLSQSGRGGKRNQNENIGGGKRGKNKAVEGCVLTHDAQNSEQKTGFTKDHERIKTGGSWSKKKEGERFSRMQLGI